MLDITKKMRHRDGLLLILIGMLMLSGCGVNSSSLAGASIDSYTSQTEKQDVIVFGDGGNAICSAQKVVSFRYTVTALPPGLTAVLAVDKAAYDALLNADIANPSTAKSPEPILDMSCTGANITTCQKTFPGNQDLSAQGICILLKNDGDKDIQANIEVTWANAQ